AAQEVVLQVDRADVKPLLVGHVLRPGHASGRTLDGLLEVVVVAEGFGRTGAVQRIEGFLARSEVTAVLVLVEGGVASEPSGRVVDVRLVIRDEGVPEISVRAD